ncbi:UNKNOWN [Stylonychia lemnae]|uniref:Uncharacterized protein n=1 Tax=Stylonychia lemnae TaxID=5949 RepID=A0A078ATB1_STYLE|nr:UNKNOWN [Stylonychia lemnae]|eukprot:CDW85690.1 UNKNOWN [Stylonychia lemnae]
MSLQNRFSNLISTKDNVYSNLQRDDFQERYKENLELRKKLNKIKLEKRKLNDSLSQIVQSKLAFQAGIQKNTEKSSLKTEDQKRIDELNEQLNQMQQQMNYQNQMRSEQQPVRKQPDLKDYLRQNDEERIQKDQQYIKDQVEELLRQVKDQNQDKPDQNVAKQISKNPPDNHHLPQIEEQAKQQAQKRQSILQPEMQKSSLQANISIKSRKVRKGTMKYLRTVTIAIMAWLGVKRLVKQRRADILYHRQPQIQNQQFQPNNDNQTVKMYADIAQAWLIKAVKEPLLSIITDQPLNLNIVDYRVDAFELQNRLLKSKIRIRAIFQGILDSTTMSHISTSLLIYLGSVFKIGSTLPKDFLTQFESQRLLITDIQGQIRSAPEIQVKALIGVFILAKILVAKVLSSPSASGLQSQIQISLQNYAFNQRSSEFMEQREQLMAVNFKIISSLIYFTVMEYIEQLHPSAKGYSLELVHSCGFKQIIYKQSDLKEYYRDSNYDFRVEMFQLIDQIIQRLIDLVKINTPINR